MGAYEDGIRKYIAGMSDMELRRLRTEGGLSIEAEVMLDEELAKRKAETEKKDK
jgi:hypothetical protein